MSKKVFIALADRIRAFNKAFPTDGFSDIQIMELADFLQSQNPRFNRERWLDYIAGQCGPSGGKIQT